MLLNDPDGQDVLPGDGGGNMSVLIVDKVDGRRWKLIAGHYGLFDGYWGLGAGYVAFNGSSSNIGTGSNGSQGIDCLDEGPAVTMRMYELIADPTERCNLIHTHPEVKLEMQRRLEAYVSIYRPQQPNSVAYDDSSRSPDSLPEANGGVWAPWLSSSVPTQPCMTGTPTMPVPCTQVIVTPADYSVDPHNLRSERS
uniref:Uncharacterized protein n=1 Tax=Haptolina brevifila TaxID=156173 RepID=A0A7S2DEK7_9EUKA|mmetsp:Transcript_37342/g.74608  ORF Transcript_37342/g.74608 Transcript_37342/m.74608 type:complete len:196 (+) Transcript_37342:1093-1680(+)